MSGTQEGKVDLVIKGGKVVTDRGTRAQWIAVNAGKIVGLGSGEECAPPAAKKTLDVTGKHVLPGVIDPEHHLVPPITESFLTETRAAIATGVTTQGMITTASWMKPLPKEMKDSWEMRVKEKTSLNAEALPFFKEVGDENSMVDWFYTPWIVTAPQCHEVEELSSKWGVTSYKLTLHTMNGEDAYNMWPHLMRVGASRYDDGDIYSLMRDIVKLGPPGILVIHPENWEISRILKEDLIKEGRDRMDPGLWCEKSPDWVEAGHVHDYSFYAKVTGCPLYVIHATTPLTFEEIRKARAEGVKLWAQCAVHYLTLDKCQWPINIPLRGKEDREACWKAIQDRTINCIGSDHVGWGRTAKQIEERGTGLEYKADVWAVWEGFASRVEALLPMLLSEGVNKGRITIERVAEISSTNVAKAFGLYPKKGVIAVGADADFAIVDLEREKTITRDMIFSRQGWSLWEGWDVKGWPVMTILRGNVMMEWPEGEPRARIVGKPDGKYLPRYPGHELYPIE
ncbi:MAG: amidohydrolase family protein [Chloroflexi bacterium]|nr:amidohydrolase family protein [Chloroflexota bacterium]